jgi:hypothetical protein
MRRRPVFIWRQWLGGSGNAGVEVPGVLFFVVLMMLVGLLALALTACQGGYTARNERISESRSGTTGEIDVHIGSANGSTTKEIEFEYDDAVVDVEATLEVEQGTFKIEFLGEDEEVTLTLEASSGQKVSGSGYMVTDSFGEGEYRVTATEAGGISYHISYSVR